MNMGSVRVDIAPGDLIDKITILVIKSERMNDSTKLKNVRMELDILSTNRDEALQPSEALQELTKKLKTVNERLWVIEDDIRGCEATKDFGSNFIKLARAVYQNNDEQNTLSSFIKFLKQYYRRFERGRRRVSDINNIENSFLEPEIQHFEIFREPGGPGLGSGPARAIMRAWSPDPEN